MKLKNYSEYESIFAPVHNDYPNFFIHSLNAKDRKEILSMKSKDFANLGVPHLYKIINSGIITMKFPKHSKKKHHFEEAEKIDCWLKMQDNIISKISEKIYKDLYRAYENHEKSLNNAIIEIRKVLPNQTISNKKFRKTLDKFIKFALFDKEDVIYHIKLIITNLWANNMMKTTKYTIMPRSDKYYVGRGKKNLESYEKHKSLYMNRDIIANLTDVMHIVDYIDLRLGYISIDDEYEVSQTEINKGKKAAKALRKRKKGYYTRIRATSKLKRMIKGYISKYLDESELVCVYSPLPIILRDKNKNEIPYNTNNSAVIRMSKNLEIINNVLKKTKITFDDDCKLDFNTKSIIKSPKFHQLVRIFNNATSENYQFDQGGRFYMHFTQMIKKEYRSHILLNGEKTIELDYGSLHISMLYAKENISIPDDKKLDLYHIDGMGKKDRPFIKKAINILINADDARKARCALANEIFPKEKYLERKREIEKIEKEEDRRIKEMCLRQLVCDAYKKAKNYIEVINDEYKAISKYFATGEGVRLQNIDSMMAEEVLIHFCSRYISCLCIHDSFIVQLRYADELKKIMEEVFFKRFKIIPIVH